MTQSTTKKQHYVPQFYLKHFAKDNKCFTILNLDKKEIIEEAPYQNQCYERYFYDNDNYYEKRISSLETNWGALLDKIINQDYYPNQQEKNLIKQFAVYQRNRTLFQYQQTKELMWQVINSGMEMKLKKQNKSIPKNFRDSFEKYFLNDEAKKMMKKMIEQYDSFVSYIDDLDICIIKYNTNLKLISSDNPIIHYNNLNFRSIGYSDAGLIIFFPINSNILIVIYDKKIYNNNNSNFIISNDEYEVKYLNKYQILNANQIVYFEDKSYSKEANKYINNSKFQKYMKLGKKNVSTLGSDFDKIIAFNIKIIYLNHNFSFAKLIGSARLIDKFSVDAFPREYNKNYIERMKFREYNLEYVLKQSNIKNKISSKEIAKFNEFVIKYWNNKL